MLSDLHLEEMPGKGPEADVDHRLSDLLRHYQTRPGDGWRLILAGDTIEFLSEEGAGESGSPPDTREARRLRRILKSHPRLLRAFADFIARGNEIHVVAGNHDLPIHWSRVQRELRFLITIHRPVHMDRRRMAEKVRQGLRFWPWFYLEPGTLYVEHGHQYDRYSSQPRDLRPMTSEGGGAPEPTFSSITMRYFSSRLEKENPHAAVWRRSTLRYLWALVRTDPLNLCRIPLYYLETVGRLILALIRFNRRRLGVPAGAMEGVRLRRLEKVSGVSTAVLREMSALAQPPILSRPWQALSALSFDLVLPWLLLLGAAAVLLWSDPWKTVSWTAPLALSWLALTFGIGLQRAKGCYQRGHFLPAARLLRRMLGVPFIVFGHSHQAGIQVLESPAQYAYFNSGVWAEDGATRFTYVEITPQPLRVTGCLMRWDSQTGSPRQIASVVTPGAPPSRTPGGRWRIGERSAS